MASQSVVCLVVHLVVMSGCWLVDKMDRKLAEWMVDLLVHWRAVPKAEYLV